MLLHIHGHDLPTAGTKPNDAGTPSVGVQRGREPALQQTRATATGHWAVEVGLVEKPDGTVDLRGPWIQGRPGDRFVYLTWGRTTADGTYTIGRRTKLMLDAVDTDLLLEAERTGRPLVAALGLARPDGTPVAAAVRPPYITWSVEDCLLGPAAV